jgi:hypothetical protein
MGKSEMLTPVERELRRRAWRRAVVVLLALVLVALGVWWAYLRQAPVDYDRIEEHFKYGSIGTEPASGVPYWVWKVLPEAFPQYLPDGGEGGYASLGFIEEPGHGTPVGFAKRRVYVELVGLNCATCHAGTVRETPDGPRQIVLGMPSHTVNLQGYYEFLFDCAADGDFTVDNLMARIATKTSLGPVEKLLYRRAIPTLREGLLARSKKLAFLRAPGRPRFGPGRVDTFNPYRVVQFDIPTGPDVTVGTADFPSLWNQRPREGMHLHWDGNNTLVHERNISAALGAGATPKSLDLGRMKRVEDWIWDLPPPPYPFAIDAARADAGKPLYEQHCAGCHAFGGARVGQVAPLGAVGTDPDRLNSFTPELAARMNTLGQGYPWHFSHFSKTDGYANMPLDGIWARAPYLHNGSVPTLRDLLEPPEGRPKKFYRGYDVYDQGKVGFVSDVAGEGRHTHFLFDTSQDGNGNGGHIWGTALTPAEKDALVEYVKRL